jgi:hypothetical protein
MLRLRFRSATSCAGPGLFRETDNREFSNSPEESWTSTARASGRRYANVQWFRPRGAALICELADKHDPARPAASAIAIALRDASSVATSRQMITRRQIKRFFDKAWVEWGMFVVGILLIVAGIVIAPIPGPGGVFLIAPGVALILKTSMWAKRHYVKLKRWQPKAGRYTDLALRRRSARRREALRKAERERRRHIPEGRSD